METVFFITHPDVLIDPASPVPDWRLNPRGIARMRALLSQTWVPGIVHVEAIGTEAGKQFHDQCDWRVVLPGSTTQAR